jgi:protease-4
MALRDPDVKAVVIRIDSPGGSALASEAAWQAVRRVAKEKPVVISIGHMAASGGYYIASAGQRIFADPSAIVGSIGVVGGKLSLKGLYDKLGVSVETYSRGANAGIFASGEGFTDGQRQMISSMMKLTYDQFIDRVMATRKGKIADIDKVARGRIFVGEQAVSLGLVDEIGGIEQATDYAASKGGLGKKYDVRILPSPKTLADVINGPQAVAPVRALEASGWHAQLMALPAPIRTLVSYQLMVAQELEQRPLLLVPPAFISVH